MANLVETSEWTAGIYQLETTDAVLGGVAGISNTQPRQLANRTKKLHDILEEVGIFVTGTPEYLGQNIMLDVTFEGTVSDGDVVYRNTSLNQFEKAIADGTEKENVVGIADVTNSKVIVHSLVTLTVAGSPDPGDILYLSDSVAGSIVLTETTKAIGKQVYGSIIFISPLGVGSGSGTGDLTNESDQYADLLGRTIYQNITYDEFAEVTASNPLVASSTMSYDSVDKLYDFTVGEITTSANLYDSVSALNPVTEAMISIDYTDSGTPTIEATADGGTHWETVENNKVHTFTNTGIDLRIRFTAGGTGELKSWAILYNPDFDALSVAVSGNRMINFYYEGIAQDEEVFIDGIYPNNRIGISHIAINARVAPTGGSLTIDLTVDGAEQSKIATLAAGSKYQKTTLSSVLQVATTEKIGLKIKSIGTIEPGQGLNVTIFYYDR